MPEALLTTHAHILLYSSDYGISRYMRRLLTGYAIRYNKRHGRHGHLFQNRYKSIVCDEESYFSNLSGTSISILYQQIWYRICLGLGVTGGADMG